MLHINGTKKSKLTKEQCENAHEEVQVVGNIVGHGRRKRFHNGVSAEYSLKKLHIQNSKEVSYHKLNYERIWIQNYTMEEEKRSKDIIESKTNIEVNCIIPSNE